ncbi:exo-rhamnogalacturonan lyase family protein [Filimonas effusa]|uniref:Tat pathway signal sequence domain protein n=1 Tax=Filimonas effusa TaxID=2508721 RepID=A0A4Q1DA66_9BACT|nr:Tat pathway signal sequence domain protein [Filimonas effusa]RXK86282.1 Tat pathway signal sequence domain protein [Filimonas effusa]
MENHNHSRRQFVRNGLLLTAALPVSRLLGSTDSSYKAGAAVPAAVPLHWLHEQAFTAANVTWGTPWPAGAVRADTSFVLQAANDTQHAVQSWPLAYWPDGSLKWSGHAAAALPEKDWQLLPGKTSPATTLHIKETATEIVVSTGIITCRFLRKGNEVISGIQRGSQTIAAQGQLVLLHQDQPSDAAEGTTRTTSFNGLIRSVIVEQQGPVRGVIKIEGTHNRPADGKQLLPFVLRFYFYSNSEAIRIVHTIVYDGNEYEDFVKGIGIRFSVPMQGELHNRHIRFSGEDNGVFAEAVRGITGLRRDAGKDARAAQVRGEAVANAAALPAPVGEHLQLVPAFGDYTLLQSSSEAFEIRKRTKQGYTWLQAATGHRATGLAYTGSASGGLAFGIRNFWQSHPGQLDIRGADRDSATVTLWAWAADAPAMDLRFYHDGLGQDDFVKQREGLDITYEDYEPGFGTPHGVARTSEFQLWALAATPSAVAFSELAQQLSHPPVLICMPAYLHSVGVFGNNWSLPDRSTAAKTRIEAQLDFYFNYYKKQVEQRHWYGFWNYGDVMHAYDTDRHVWRYDVGGYAWDNSELSTDLWLWYYFLRTGRTDVFRMAEAMTRHTGEVDVHHIGRFAPLGSRHNVLHWGCSAKQLRISTAANRRFYFYLTADERTGDLMREQVNAAHTLVTIQPGRKLGGQKSAPPAPPATTTKAQISFGTDWGAIAAAWFTEWERTGDKKIKQKLENSMTTIASQPLGFFAGGAVMDLDTGRYELSNETHPVAPHLNAVFGLTEICAELVQHLSVPAFEKAWVQYCTLYNAPAAEQKAALGEPLTKNALRQGHARLTAYAAYRTGNKALAQRAWKEFYADDTTDPIAAIPQEQRINTPEVLQPIDEVSSISTNGVAQWALSAIQCLGLAGEALNQ